MKKNTDKDNSHIASGHFSVLWHISAGLLILGLVFAISYALRNWTTEVDLTEIAASGEADADRFYYDNIVPLTDEDGYLIRQQVDTILLLGGAPFAPVDDDSPLADLLSEKSGARVINCTCAGSYMARSNAAEDLLNPDRLARIFCGLDQSKDADGLAPFSDPQMQERVNEITELLSSGIAEDVDLILWAYDGTDYLLDHPLVNEYNLREPLSTVGNLASACDLIRETYPGIRQVVLSPTYFTLTLEDGTILEPDSTPNSYATMGEYASRLYDLCVNTLQLTYVDNYNNTITRDNVSQYTTDGLHFNQKGREFYLQRLMDVLTYFAPGSESP